MGLNKYEYYYLIFCFIISFILACLLLLIRINFSESSCVSILFALFFLTFYFYQPFLICIDRLKSYVSYYSLEKPKFDISYFLKYEFQIIGWVGTGFSNFILPMHKDYILSGYGSRCGKVKDVICRLFKKWRFKIVLLLIYIIVSYILYRIKDKDKDIEEKSIGLADFLKNCLILLDFFKALWYLGAFFPLLISQLKIECDSCKCPEYYNQLINNIDISIQNDQKKLIKCFEELYYISITFIKNNIRRLQVSDLLNSIKESQEILKIKLPETEKELEDINKKLKEEVNADNFEEKIISGIRAMIKRLSKIPRKIYERANLYREINNKNNCFYYIFAISMVVFGTVTIGFELTLYFIDYNQISSPRNFTYDYIWAFVISFFYFAVLYYAILKKNSLTQQNLYGIKQSDTLCLLNFTEEISGMITPLSFLFVGTKAMGIFQLRDYMTFMETFDMPLVENIFITLNFKDIYYMYISIRLIVIAVSFVCTFFLNTIEINCCCCCKFKWKINDRNLKSIGKK